jgi:hypothetical protein
MVLYGLGLWGQTLLAVAALGLVGGWALWPFRRDDRPFLWLAAPLAGLAVLALALCPLYFACRLPLPWCLAVAGPSLAAATCFLLLRRGRAGVKGWPWAAAAALAVSAMFTLGSNATAVRLGEPTVCLREGTDTIGYSLFADWFLQHPGEKPGYGPELPNQAFIHADWDDTRPGAFLLAAAAAWARGTTALFSYDWANGVALACGAMGLAGLFASGRLSLPLLLAAAVLSQWFPASRCGYFGKTLAYPGCLLLGYLFWEACRRPGAARLLTAGVVGAGVCLSLHPMVPQAVLGLLLAGLGLALVVHPLLGPAAPGGPPRRLDFRLLLAVGLLTAAVGLTLPPTPIRLVALLLGWPAIPYPAPFPFRVAGLSAVLLIVAAAALGLRRLRPPAEAGNGRQGQYARLTRAAGVYLLMVGPAALYIFWLTPHSASPTPPLPWPRLAAIALDLDGAVVPLVRPALLPWLMGGALGLTAIAFLLALRARDAEAGSYLLGVALLPAAWLLGKTQLYEFHGLLFPLTAAGAVLLAQRLWAASRPWGYAALALAAALVGVRAPQAWHNWPRYTRAMAGSPSCFPRSEIDALAALVAGKKVDVAVSHVHAALVLMVELTARGTPPRYREPAWTMTLAFTRWKAPELEAGDFVIADAAGWASPEALCLRDRHFTVSRTDRGLSILALATPHDRMAFDALGHPGFWQGGQPITVELWNGTGQARAVSLLAECQPGPSRPDMGKRTVRYALGDCRGARAVGGAAGWSLALPLELPPGRSRLSLAVEEPATASLGPNDPRDLLLLLTDFRLGPPPDNYRPGAAPPPMQE